MEWRILVGEKRVLFSHWDGGRGHLNRVLDVAKESKLRGYYTGIITTQGTRDSLPVEFDEVYSVPNRPDYSGADVGYELPLYSHARSHGQRLRGLGFSRDFILDTNKLELDVVDYFKPDIIVNDYRDTIKNVADLLNIPLVGIVQSNGHVDGQKLGWFEVVGDEDVPSCLSSFNEARESLGLSELMDEREMFGGDVRVIPSIPEVDPLLSYSSDTVYSGLLSYRTNIKGVADGHRVPPHSYLVCNVSASNRRRYGQDELMKSVVDLIDISIVSAGEERDYNYKSRSRIGSYIASKFIDYDTVFPDSKAFISYGGHGSTLAALEAGLPILGLGPFSSEQRGTLENIKSYGAGTILSHGDGLESIRASDMNGLNIYGNWNSSITPESIVESIDNILSNENFALRSMELSYKLRKLNGRKIVNDTIEDLL